MQSWDIKNFNKMQILVGLIQSASVYVCLTYYFSLPARILVMSSSVLWQGSFRILGQSLLSAVSSCCSSSGEYISLHEVSQITVACPWWSVLFTISERRTPGKIPGVFRNISTTKCIYTGVRFASLAFHIDFYQS